MKGKDVEELLLIEMGNIVNNFIGHFVLFPSLSIMYVCVYLHVSVYTRVQYSPRPDECDVSSRTGVIGRCELPGVSWGQILGPLQCSMPS